MRRIFYLFNFCLIAFSTVIVASSVIIKRQELFFTQFKISLILKKYGKTANVFKLVVYNLFFKKMSLHCLFHWQYYRKIFCMKEKNGKKINNGLYLVFHSGLFLPYSEFSSLAPVTIAGFFPFLHLEKYKKKNTKLYFSNLAEKNSMSFFDISSTGSLRGIFLDLKQKRVVLLPFDKPHALKNIVVDRVTLFKKEVIWQSTSIKKLVSSYDASFIMLVPEAPFFFTTTAVIIEPKSGSEKSIYEIFEEVLLKYPYMVHEWEYFLKMIHKYVYDDNYHEHAIEAAKKALICKEKLFDICFRFLKLHCIGHRGGRYVLGDYDRDFLYFSKKEIKIIRTIIKHEDLKKIDTPIKYLLQLIMKINYCLEP